MRATIPGKAVVPRRAYWASAEAPELALIAERATGPTILGIPGVIAGPLPVLTLFVKMARLRPERGQRLKRTKVDTEKGEDSRHF
jgi:hypothetical protein